MRQVFKFSLFLIQSYLAGGAAPKSDDRDAYRSADRGDEKNVGVGDGFKPEFVSFHLVSSQHERLFSGATRNATFNFNF